MAGIAGHLIFIKDDLAFCIHPSGAVYPHVTFAPGRAAVLIHQYGRLVCLQDVAAVQLFVEVIIKDRKVTRVLVPCEAQV